MQLIIKNNSSDIRVYVSGKVTIEANTNTEIEQSLWLALAADLDFLRDIKLNNIILNDGVQNYTNSVEALALLKELQPKDSDGRVLNRPVAGKAGWKAQFHAIRVSTATINGVYNKNKSGQDLGFCAYVMKDSNGEVTNNPAECVQTIVTWEPTHDMEIIGGMLMQKANPDQDVYMYVTAAAHIPSQYGGSVAFAEGGINLADAPANGKVDFNGRAAKYIAYDSINHSGRFEILLNHPVGYVHKFTMIFELFRP